MARKLSRKAFNPRQVDGVWQGAFPWQRSREDRRRELGPKGGRRWQGVPIHRAPDPWARVRSQLTDELRRACELLAARERDRYRGFPALRTLLVAELAQVTGEDRNGRRVKTQALVDKLVALGILYPFGRQGDRLDTRAPGAFAALLTDRSPVQHDSIGRLVSRTEK